MFDDLRRAGRIDRHDRLPEGERLDEHEPERLPFRRVHEHVEGCDPGVSVLLLAGENDAISDPKLGRELLQARCVVPIGAEYLVTDDDKP